MKKVTIVLILSLLVLGGVFYLTQNPLAKYQEVVRDAQYIRHALGGADGYTYLNSVKVMEEWYEKDSRIYEVDVALTSDGRAALSHG